MKERSLYLYAAYGLGICSEICLPELPNEFARADIEIKREKMDYFFESLVRDAKRFWANESKIFRFLPNIGSFLIRNGREIVVDPDPCADERLFRHCLLGQILGTLLHQRGLLVLHGSAVRVNGRGVVFLGPSGYGKSTMVASLTSKGYGIIADDIVAIDANNSMPMIYPAFPQLRLWPEVAEFLGYDLSNMQHVVPTEEKRVACHAASFSTDPVPLERIYFLEREDTVEIKRLGQQESMIELVRNTYVIDALNAGVQLSSHFSQCSKVAKEVPICRLLRPFNFGYLKDLTLAIEDDLRYHGSVIQN